MLTRRALLASSLLTGCVRSPLGGDEMPLQRTPVTVKLSGLDTKAVPGTAIPGKLKLAENVMGKRRTDGGVEFIKRYGRTNISTSTSSGGSITAGKKVGALRGELVMTDGHTLYSNGQTSEGWVARGSVTDVAAVLERVASNGGSDHLDVDVAYASTAGLLCFTSSRDETADGYAEYYIQDATTGALVHSGSVDSLLDTCLVRVVASPTAFFLFFWDRANSLYCRKIDCSAGVTPDSSSTLVSAVSSLTCIFDVIWDSTNSRMVVGFHNDTPGLTLMIWTTGMTAGASVSYTTRDPDRAIGFLDYSFTSGSGYVAVATSSGGGAAGLYLLTFGASNMTVSASTQVDASATDCDRVTGYFSAVPNLFYSREQSTYHLRRIQGWKNGSAWTVMRSLGLASKPIKIDGKWYLMGSYHGLVSPAISASLQNSQFLLELTEDTSAATSGGVSIAGLLAQGNLAGWATGHRSVGALAAVSATKAVSALNIVEQAGAPSASTIAFATGLAKVSLDWTGTLTGKLVEFNDVLYIPGAAPKIFDGHHVMEAGPYVYPEAPTLTAVASGSLTLLGTYVYTAVYFRWDAQGKVWESAESYPASVTLTGANQGVTVVVPTLRVTQGDHPYTQAPLPTSWYVGYFRSTNAGTPRFLGGYTINDPTADSVTFNDTTADTDIDNNALVYTAVGQVENIAPPCVLAFEHQGGRLFAACADGGGGSIWHTKKASGKAAQFSDIFRLPLDGTGGVLTGLVPLDGGMVATKRGRLYPIVGEGPDNAGAGPFATPLPRDGSEGMTSARLYASTPKGVLIKGPKGIRLLDQAGNTVPVEGADTYDSLSVTGGVSLDDRPYACLVTSDGRALVRDSQLEQWYTWTNYAAVDCCRWNNRLVILASDGRVSYEDSTSYQDPSGTSINAKIRTGTLALADLFGRLRLYGVRVLGEAMASFTLSLTTHIRIGSDLVEETTTEAVTTSTKFPLAVQPAQERVETLEITVEETSTTQGFALSALGLEVGVKPGAGKQPGAQFMG